MLFMIVKDFRVFDEPWSKSAFILVVGYKKSNVCKWQLLNWIIGEAKLSIYSIRKNRNYMFCQGFSMAA